MDSCEFTYRGEALGDYELVLCYFSQTGISPITTDSQRTFVTIPMFGGKRFPFLFSKYDNALVATMSVCKSPDADSVIISRTEAATIKRWLSAPTPEELRFEGVDEYEGISWYGSFNVEEVHLDGDCVGFNLTFTCNAPFGYYDEVVLTGSVSAGDSITINDVSDEEGYIYPDMMVKLGSAGDLIITNSSDGRSTVVNNCSSGETISFSHLLQISSDVSTHKLGNDFNYRFTRINNTYNDVTNVITFNIACDYTLAYRPIAKVVIA